MNSLKNQSDRVYEYYMRKVKRRISGSSVSGSGSSASTSYSGPYSEYRIQM